MAAESDNLDARMEVIRLKNEELEKKHKEIIEDELNAKRQNATVDIKCRDIEKTNEPHPYDKLDLDFDVKDTDKEMAKNPDYIPKRESSESSSCYLHLQVFFFIFSFSSYLR